MLSIELPDSIGDRLKEVSVNTNKSKEYFVIEAIRRYLEDIEDYEIALSRSMSSDRSFLTTEQILQELNKDQ